MFFSIPLDEFREEWIKAIKVYQEIDNVSGYFLVCSNHFDKNQIITKNGRPTLCYGTIPNKFDGPPRATQVTSPAPSDISSKEYILEKRQYSIKIKALEKKIVILNKKTKSSKAESTDLKKQLLHLQKKSDSQSQTILNLEKKIKDIEAAEPLIGVQIVCNISIQL